MKFGEQLDLKGILIIFEFGGHMTSTGRVISEKPLIKNAEYLQVQPRPPNFFTERSS